MRYIYAENERIERSPPRKNGDPIVIISKHTGFPEVGKWSNELGVMLYSGDGGWFKVSPDYWEIAWP